AGDGDRDDDREHHHPGGPEDGGTEAGEGGPAGGVGGEEVPRENVPAVADGVVSEEDEDANAEEGGHEQHPARSARDGLAAGDGACCLQGDGFRSGERHYSYASRKRPTMSWAAT